MAKSAISEYKKNTINILLSVMITAGVFYSSNLGQRISEIYASYVVDTNTLNNTFITLGIKASLQDNDGFQKVKNDLDKQMEQFNQKYEKLGKEQKAKETVKLWLDRAIYILILVLIMFNALNVKAQK